MNRQKHSLSRYFKFREQETNYEKRSKQYALRPQRDASLLHSLTSVPTLLPDSGKMSLSSLNKRELTGFWTKSYT